MKKLFLIFLCTGLLLSALEVFAEQKIMVNEDGEVWPINHFHQWEGASEAEMRAYRQPGIEVPINLQTGKPKKVDFFHYIPVQEYDEVIVWNGEKFQTIKKAGEEYGEPKLAWHIIFLLAAIIFMAISNIAMKKEKRLLPIYAAFVTFIFAFFTLDVTPFPVTPIVFATFVFFSTVFGVAFALLVTVVAIIGNRGKYKIFSTIFYILSFSVIIMWLTT